MVGGVWLPKTSAPVEFLGFPRSVASLDREIQIIRLLLTQLAISPKSRAELHMENLVLRHQLDVLRRSAPKRLSLTNADRLVLAWLLGLWPQVVRSIHIVHPNTLVRWHRQGFKIYWRWKSRSRGGRPKVTAELRTLIRQMST